MADAKGRPKVVKLVACLVAMAVLVACVLFLVADGRDGTARGLDEGTTPTPPDPAVSIEAVGPLPSSAPSPVVREVARAPVDAAGSSSWRGELAGLIGRVVESDGTPVAGMRVALLEVDATHLFEGSSIDADEPRLELEETVTDREGRFLLGGARGPSFHGLGVDLGGPRATLRVIDHALPHRERTDIGDVVLAPYGVLTGRVIDESGAPVLGARVRFGPFPAQILQASPQEFRSDSLISIGAIPLGGEKPTIIELPDWIRASIDRFPVPTTYSSADGGFRLEGVALAQVVGGIDKRGYVGVPLGPLDVSGGEHDLGEVVLAHGRTIRGVVEDGYGEPANGVEVYAGAELFPGIVAILQPCGPTDDEGRFELSGVAETGQIVAVSRRAKHEPWSSTVTSRPDNVLIEIEATVQLTVNVRDELGEPLSGARIQLSPGRRPGTNRGFSEVLMVLPRPASSARVFSEVEPGRYVNASLGAGLYDITARAPGLAPAYLQAECRATVNEVTLVCSTGRRIELTVLDAVTKTAVAGARASALHVGSTGFSKIAVQSTDQDGRALLGPLPNLGAEAGPDAFFPAETMVLVQHPRYSDHSANLEPNAVPLVVELQAGGALAGRVHWGGAVPTRLYMLTLEYRGADGFLEAFHMPRFSVTDFAGEFRVAALAPGQYSVELSERFLDQDPLGLMNDEFSAPTLHREELEIRNGETTELVIDLTPTGRGATARIVGRVRVDGRNLQGAEVEVRGNERVKVVTDSSGRFETVPFSIREGTWISIEGDVPLAGAPARRMPLYSESVELADGDVHEIDLDLYPLTLRVQVVDSASGEPVPEAQVSAEAKDHGDVESFDRQGQGSATQANTNATGEAVLLILKPGQYSLEAKAAGFGEASSQVDVPEQGLSEATSIRLPRAVPCAGRVQVVPSESAALGQGFAYLHVQGEDNTSSSGTMLNAPDYEFTLDGLAAGKYQGRIYLGGRQGEEVLFELGPDGDRDLVLSFIPSED